MSLQRWPHSRSMEYSTIYLTNGALSEAGCLQALPGVSNTKMDISLRLSDFAGAGLCPRPQWLGGGDSPLMTSCRFTWLLGRLCRVPGGTSSRQPGGSSGSSSSPDRPGSPSSPGSGLWDRGLIRAPAQGIPEKSLQLFIVSNPIPQGRRPAPRSGKKPLTPLLGPLEALSDLSI